MSIREPADDAVRDLILLFPRLVGRAKRIAAPEQLRAFDLAPRHLSLLSLLLLDGAQTVSELAGQDVVIVGGGDSAFDWAAGGLEVLLRLPAERLAG